MRKRVLLVAVMTAVACMMVPLPAQAQQAPDGPVIAVAAAAVVDLERVEVRVQLDAPTSAVELKRDASAIQDALASDAMGYYPDMNIAESPRRLPAVSITSDQARAASW